jgi:transposase
MHVRERTHGDLDRLGELIRRERDAEQRDRLNVVRLALLGQQTVWIVQATGRSRAFIQRWVYVYRDHGLEHVRDKPRGGSRPKVPPDVVEHLRARLQAGPTPHDRVCSLRGEDVRRILREEHRIDVSLNAVYKTLHRMGYACLHPRPRHQKQDPAAQQRFREESAPLLSGSFARRSPRTGDVSASSSRMRPGLASRAR